MRTFALLLLAAGACTDDAIQMHLVVPSSTAAFDLSCVTAVDLLPIAVGDTKPLDIGEREAATMVEAPCIDITTPLTSLADVESALHGLTSPLPTQGLAAVEIRGRAGSCKENPAYHEAVFYGGAAYTAGSGQLDIPIAHNISCDAATSYNVRPIDLIALTQSKTCAAITSGSVYSGDIRPTLLGKSFEPVQLEYGPAFHDLDALAGGAVMLGSYKGSFTGACPTAVYSNTAQTATFTTCITAGAPTVCGATGEVEVPTFTGGYIDNSVDKTLGAQFAGITMGAVWTTTGAKAPLPGATITLDEASPASVVYGQLGITSFTAAQGATATDASGGFMLYANGIVGVTVAAPGHASRHVYIGAAEFYGGELIVLP